MTHTARKLSTTFKRIVDAVSERRYPDGPGVFRRIIDKQTLLARAPHLAGKLEPPTGVTLDKDPASGIRVVSVSVAGARDIDALREMARFINQADADVVLVQDISAAGDNVSLFAHLIKATQKIFTPAMGAGAKPAAQGTAIYTRNGFMIDRAVNAALPGVPAEASRNAGIAAVSSADGIQHLTVISTRLSLEDKLRERQINVLTTLTETLRDTGVFMYRDALEGQQCYGREFPRYTVVLGGDHAASPAMKISGVDKMADVVVQAAPPASVVKDIKPQQHKKYKY